ncbi:MAG: molybdenum cofactor biosynthesis protein MoaE [Candidatus Sumerlaeaceae bacterium]|nr:molybdenum cofactor biosynthesis protein MoaE [Candidatus Sumerlaeaceae bacterium]
MGETLAQLLAADTPINLEELVAFASSVPHGALVAFHGVVRPLENNQPIKGLLYEAHETLTERELRRVVESVVDQHSVMRVACAHRTGIVLTGQIAVAIYVSAEHRGPAFNACQVLIAELKKRVPIWKSPVY